MEVTGGGVSTLVWARVCDLCVFSVHQLFGFIQKVFASATVSPTGIHDPCCYGVYRGVEGGRD